MAGSGKRWVICLLAVLLASVFSEEQVNIEIETKETTQKSEISRSGAYYASEEDSYADHLESNKQQQSEVYAAPGGYGNSYSYSDQQKAYENSQHHASQYQQVNQPRYYGSPGPVYGPGQAKGFNYHQANEESLKQQLQYNYNQQANYNQQGYAIDNVITRPIPNNEYYWIHRQPGYENTISCQREGELHSYWTPNNECMICACVKEWLYLEPACVSCGLCTNPQPLPVPIPATERYNLPVYITTTEVIPEPVPEIVTCSPMPSGTPFQNPLNPCQICICYESVSMFGVPDVKIECKENKQCVLPPEPIPYIPDEPLPLPQCEKFPNNVMFPHPVEPCKICKCSVDITPYGPQDQITCFPDSDCIPPAPIIPPAPVTVYPIPPEPLIIPVTEPVWPVTPRPNPGPLPGPSPHESCRPYLPNQPFQHPWDECQLCVCVEGYTVGQITIEINCYTKKSCCIEIPFEQTIAPLPYIPTQPGQIQVVATPVYSNQYGTTVPGYNKLISPKPSYGYIPGNGQKYYSNGQSPYLTVTNGQGSYGQSTGIDESEHYDKNLSYDQKAYQQGTYGNYGPGAYSTGVYSPVTYNQGAYGQSTAYGESENYDKSLSYDQKAYGQTTNGQGVVYAPGTYGQGVYYGQAASGQSLAYDNSEHYDKSLSYDQKAYSQNANGQGIAYAPGSYGQGVNYGQAASGQSLAYDNSEHYDKSLSYDENAYGQSTKGQGVVYAPGTYGKGVTYGQTASGQSLAYDKNEHYDKSLNYDQKAYSQTANGQGITYAPGSYGQGVNYGQAASGQSLTYDKNEHYDKSLNYDQKAYSQTANGQAAVYAPGSYGQGVNYGQAASGQSLAYDNSEHYDKSLNYDQKAYSQTANGQGIAYAPGSYGQGVNYGQAASGQSLAYDESEHYDKSLSYDQKAYNQGANYGIYGQIPAKLGLGVGPVKMSVKARPKSGDPENYEASNERK